LWILHTNHFTVDSGGVPFEHFESFATENPETIAFLQSCLDNYFLEQVSELLRYAGAGTQTGVTGCKTKLETLNKDFPGAMVILQRFVLRHTSTLIGKDLFTSSGKLTRYANEWVDVLYTLVRDGTLTPDVFLRPKTATPSSRTNGSGSLANVSQPAFTTATTSALPISRSPHSVTTNPQPDLDDSEDYPSPQPLSMNDEDGYSSEESDVDSPYSPQKKAPPSVRPTQADGIGLPNLADGRKPGFRQTQPTFFGAHRYR
jgi:hypothetical protein